MLYYAKSLQSCLTHRRQPTRLRHPWDSPGKDTGVGCHFLLQCMKEKSESEVTQSCPTLCDPMDCHLTGSSVHGIFQARVLEWGAIAFSRQRQLAPTKSPMHFPRFPSILWRQVRVTWLFLANGLEEEVMLVTFQVRQLRANIPSPSLSSCLQQPWL